MSYDDPYTYPGTNVLINHFGVRDAERLEHIERRYVANRLDEGTPSGNFDLSQLQNIHHHLFQDVYPWAGEIRTVQLAKTNWFLPAERIEMGVADVHRQLQNANFLKDTNSAEFAEHAAGIIADINHAHPFREGNGRTQLQYFKQLAEHAGHPVNLDMLDRDQWIAASIQSHAHDPMLMRSAIANSLAAPDQGATREPPEQNEELTQSW